MPAKLLIGENDRVGPWVMGQLGMEWFPGSGTTIGLEDESGEIIAGLVYENCNGVNCFVHIAAVPGRRWGNRDFLYYAFAYPFLQLGCDRISGIVASTNKDALNLNIRVGMELEAVLYGAAPNGHLLIYRMFKKDCKWLSLGEHHGQEQGTESA